MNTARKNSCLLISAPTNRSFREQLKYDLDTIISHHALHLLTAIVSMSPANFLVCILCCFETLLENSCSFYKVFSYGRHALHNNGCQRNRITDTIFFFMPKLIKCIMVIPCYVTKLTVQIWFPTRRLQCFLNSPTVKGKTKEKLSIPLETHSSYSD